MALITQQVLFDSCDPGSWRAKVEKWSRIFDKQVDAFRFVDGKRTSHPGEKWKVLSSQVPRSKWVSPSADYGSGRVFLAVREDNFFPLLQEVLSNEKYFYEILRENAPVHLFFDCEFPRGHHSIALPKSFTNDEHKEVDIALNGLVCGEKLVALLLFRCCVDLSHLFPHGTIDEESISRHTCGTSGHQLASVEEAPITTSDAERRNFPPALFSAEDVIHLDSSTANKFSRHLIIRLKNGAMFRNTAHAGEFVRSVLYSILEGWKQSDSTRDQGSVDPVSVNGTASAEEIVVNTPTFQFTKEEILRYCEMTDTSSDKEAYFSCLEAHLSRQFWVETDKFLVHCPHKEEVSIEAPQNTAEATRSAVGQDNTSEQSLRSLLALESFVDARVYTKNRAMRMPYSGKRKESGHMLFMPARSNRFRVTARTLSTFLATFQQNMDDNRNASVNFQSTLRPVEFSLAYWMKYVYALDCSIQKPPTVPQSVDCDAIETNIRTSSEITPIDNGQGNPPLLPLPWILRDLMRQATSIDKRDGTIQLQDKTGKILTITTKSIAKEKPEDAAAIGRLDHNMGIDEAMQRGANIGMAPQKESHSNIHDEDEDQTKEMMDNPSVEGTCSEPSKLASLDTALVIASSRKREQEIVRHSLITDFLYPLPEEELVVSPKTCLGIPMAITNPDLTSAIPLDETLTSIAEEFEQGMLDDLLTRSLDEVLQARSCTSITPRQTAHCSISSLATNNPNIPNSADGGTNDARCTSERPTTPPPKFQVVMHPHQDYLPLLVYPRLLTTSQWRSFLQHPRFFTNTGASITAPLTNSLIASRTFKRCRNDASETSFDRPIDSLHARNSTNMQCTVTDQPAAVFPFPGLQHWIEHIATGPMCPITHKLLYPNQSSLYIHCSIAKWSGRQELVTIKHIPRDTSFFATEKLQVNEQQIQAKAPITNQTETILVFTHIDIHIRNSRYCYAVSRHHKSNGVIWKVNLLAGNAYQVCWDPDCRGLRSPVFSLPPSILPNQIPLGAIVVQQEE